MNPLADSVIKNSLAKKSFSMGAQTIGAYSHTSVDTGVTDDTAIIVPFISGYNSSAYLDIALGMMYSSGQWSVRADSVTFTLACRMIT